MTQHIFSNCTFRGRRQPLFLALWPVTDQRKKQSVASPWGNQNTKHIGTWIKMNQAQCSCWLEITTEKKHVFSCPCTLKLFSCGGPPLHSYTRSWWFHLLISKTASKIETFPQVRVGKTMSILPSPGQLHVYIYRTKEHDSCSGRIFQPISGENSTFTSVSTTGTTSHSPLKSPLFTTPEV